MNLHCYERRSTGFQASPTYPSASSCFVSLLTVPLTSFGDPNAQPPTPKQTPTSAIFPSPVFETPKNNRCHLDESSGWTPRFAEEYSVFNSTPGNLRGEREPSAEFGSLTPYPPPSAGQKRLLSADDIAADIATHGGHFSPKPNISSLSPVDPHRRLPSSANPFAGGFEECVANDERPSSQERTSKKVRRGTIAKQGQGQTATPPPSTRKGSRKLAPKLDINTMQHAQGFSQPDFTDAAQQPNMDTFVTTPGDMFGYPLSATAPAFADQRPFWDQDPGIAGMEMDFGPASADVFQPPTPGGHGPMGSIDWSRANQIFPEPGVVPQHNQENAHPARRERLIAAKASMRLDTSSADQSMFVGTYPTAIDDPFGIVGNSGGVDPGLLFSRPPSSSMDNPFNPVELPPSSSAPPAPQSTQPSQPAPAPARIKTPAAIRRSMSVKELGSGKRTDRTIVSSPTRSTGRPGGLSRSFSETRGKKPVGRASLPTLAPAAPRPQAQLSSSAGVGASRPVVSQHSRAGGRSSPLKSHHHHRLSSLSSIPETLGARARTQAKFTIDANGRARVETTVMVDEVAPPTIRTRHSAQPLLRHPQWNSSEDDDSSSEDDDPIIIPSRNTSFALPEPPKPSNTHPFHSSQRSISDLSTASYGSLLGGSPDDGESEAETVMNEATPTGKPGDAASELRKLRESRQKKAWSAKQRQFASSGLSTAAFVGSYSEQDIVSPTTLTNSSLPTPSTDSRSHGLRCVCNRLEVDRDGNGFMVQWYGVPQCPPSSPPIEHALRSESVSAIPHPADLNSPPKHPPS